MFLSRHVPSGSVPLWVHEALDHAEIHIGDQFTITPEEKSAELTERVAEDHDDDNGRSSGEIQLKRMKREER